MAFLYCLSSITASVTTIVYAQLRLRHRGNSGDSNISGTPAMIDMGVGRCVTQLPGCLNGGPLQCGEHELISNDMLGAPC